MRMKAKFTWALLIGIAFTMPAAANDDEDRFEIEESPSESESDSESEDDSDKDNKSDDDEKPSSTSSTTESEIKFAKPKYNPSAKLKNITKEPQKCEIGDCDPYAEPGDDCTDDFADAQHHCYWEDENETEDLYYREGDLDADWPGKRTDPFYDNLTR